MKAVNVGGYWINPDAIDFFQAKGGDGLVQNTRIVFRSGEELTLHLTPGALQQELQKHA